LKAWLGRKRHLSRRCGLLINLCAPNNLTRWRNLKTIAIKEATKIIPTYPLVKILTPAYHNSAATFFVLYARLPKNKTKPQKFH
jgi:hypothetical protein